MNASSGLDGVIAADTVMSEVDGQAGRLIIRGYALDQLVGRSSYEQVLELLLDGFFTELPGTAFARALGAARAQVFSSLLPVDGRLLARPPIEALRALIGVFTGMRQK